MRRWLLRGALALLGLLVLAAGTGYGALRWYQQASRDPAFFEDDIRAFEAADHEHPPAPGGIVFTGSSSIRFWSTLAEDMAPLPVRNRGFGGSQMSHLVHFARRIVTPYEPAAVVVFCGANDVSSGKTPEQVVADFEALLAIVRKDAPGAHVYFLSIKPSPLRFARWPEIRRANAAVEALAAEASDLSYVDVAAPLLTPDGTLRRELYRFDRLHLNAKGYAAWTEVVRPLLLRDLGGRQHVGGPGG
jgi:lysophospholipase L1-like esterase